MLLMRVLLVSVVLMVVMSKVVALVWLVDEFGKLGRWDGC